MRRLTLFAVLILLAVPVPALAAPTCQTADGDTIKCGADGAMPVGWTLPAEAFAARHPDQPVEEDSNDVLKAICMVALLLAFIASLPQFDGRNDGDWDRQEGDEPKRR